MKYRAALLGALIFLCRNASLPCAAESTVEPPQRSVYSSHFNDENKILVTKTRHVLIVAYYSASLLCLLYLKIGYNILVFSVKEHKRCFWRVMAVFHTRG